MEIFEERILLRSQKARFLVPRNGHVNLRHCKRILLNLSVLSATKERLDINPFKSSLLNRMGYWRDPNQGLESQEMRTGPEVQQGSVHKTVDTTAILKVQDHPLHSDSEHLLLW